LTFSSVSCKLDLINTKVLLTARALFCAREVYSLHALSHPKGPLGAYQGIIPTLYRNAPSNAAWYGVYEWARAAQLKEGQARNDLTQLQVMIAGGAGGLAYWLSIYPIDVIKSTVQSDHPDPAHRKYSGMVDASRKIYHTHGMSGFFRGIAPCLARAIPANAATFVAYESAVNILSNK
jgi:solute carrier family 25 carnitine/acylcarnitine transporter 20/29